MVFHEIPLTRASMRYATQCFSPQFLSMCMAFMLGVAGAMAADRSWSGAAMTPDWFTSANWNPSDNFPQAGDNVTIAGAASVVITGSTPMLGSFQISSATLVFTNWGTTLGATNVFLRNGSLLTLPGPFRTADSAMSNNLTISCVNLVLEAGALVDVSGKGHNYNDGPGKGSNAVYSCGAGHGGRGGDGFNNLNCSGWGGAPYDDPAAPVLAGSGGGCYQIATPANRGGAGGGAVRITASGELTLDGIIRATGNVSGHASGGGSGGSVYITCGLFGGTTSGLIDVSGGAATNGGGGGGGGCIAVDYENIGADHAVRFKASPGGGKTATNEWSHKWMHAAKSGTLFLPDARLLSTSLTNWQFQDVRLDIGAAKWEVESLTLSNSSLFFNRPGFELVVTNDLKISSGFIGIGQTNGNGLTILNVGGDLLLTNEGALYVYACATNGTGRDYGAEMTIAGDVSLTASSWIYPYAHNRDGGTVLMRMRNLFVGSGAGINADAKGYDTECGPGCALSLVYAAGGGYGGRGGEGIPENSEAAMGSHAYGSASDPIDPGSGGGKYQLAGPNRGGQGGGAIRIIAQNNVIVDGELSATGETHDHVSGAGSGGAINIACATFGGHGVLRANGGDHVQANAGGGGGGRIAVAYTDLAPIEGIRFSAAMGASAAQATPGDTRAPWLGTIYLSNTDLLDKTLGPRFKGVFMAPGFEEWSPDFLKVSNTCVAFKDGFKLNVSGNIDIMDNGLLAMGTNSELTCGGNMTLTNSSALMIFAGATSETVKAGALVEVEGVLTVEDSCWVYPYSHETLGGAPLFYAGSLVVKEGGGFNADAAGYLEYSGPGRGNGGSAYCAGAGHGGKGGKGSTAAFAPGNPYGVSNAPVLPGSGGGNYRNTLMRARGGHGGGVIRIISRGNAVVNGVISANGGHAENASGGGSGGSIFLVCGSLIGSDTAIMRANGGNGKSNGGGGGGGRIAVWIGKNLLKMFLAGRMPRHVIWQDEHPAFQGAVQVAPGDGYVHYPDADAAFPGTAWFLTMPPRFIITVY